MDHAPLMVWTTFPDLPRAEEAAETLVRESLAACVQIVPEVRSFYVWQGALQRDREWLVIIKSRQGRYDELQRRLVALHPYEVPEILATPVVAGWPAYLAWLGQNTGASPTPVQE